MFNLSLKELPESQLIKIFERVKLRSLIRFHKTCSFLDSFIYAHRKEIAVLRRNRWFVPIVVTTDNYRVNGIALNPTICLKKQMSAARFIDINVHFMDETIEPNNLENLKRALEALLVPSNCISIEGEYSAKKEILDFISSFKLKKICIITSSMISLDFVVSHPFLKSAPRFGLYAYQIEESFNVKTIFKRIKRLQEVNFNFTRQHIDLTFKILRGFLKEFESYSGQFPYVEIDIHDAKLDVKKFIPELKIVWKHISNSDVAVFLMQFPSKLAIVETSAYTQSGQRIMTYRISKAKQRMRTVLEQITCERMEDDVFEHISQGIEFTN